MIDEHRSDVIVIGSGPSGVSAAAALLEAGVRVLMLDASSSALGAAASQISIGARRRESGCPPMEVQAEGNKSGVSPKLATPLAQSVLAGFAESLRLSGRDFMPVGSLAAGGLSQIWGAFAHPYKGRDLAGFPDHAGFASSLSRTADRIGISAPNDRGDDTSAHLTAPIRRLLERHRARPRQETVSLSLATNAVLSHPKEDRKACNGCGLCLYGCARGAIYSSTFDLPALRRNPLFTYRPGHRVLALEGAYPDHKVVTRCVGAQRVFRARRVLLAAGTIASTSLAVRRLGLQNRRIKLLSNPVGGSALLVPSLIGRELPERSFALGQLSFRLALGTAQGVAADMFGVLYGADALPLGPIADRLPFTRATSLRLARALAPALVLASGYLPGHFSDNQMAVEGGAESGRVVIDGTRTPEADALLRQGFTQLSRFARRRGAWMLPGATTLLPPGADAHLAGTFPMGGAGDLATSDFGEVRACEGLYIVDGASLPSLSAVHPTLTIMANADRIGRHVARVCHEEGAYADV